IDAGDAAVCAAAPVSNRDQRGSVRPGLGHARCSIGAYEADSSPSETCAGDCDTNGSVAIDDLVTLVSIALNAAPVSTCTVGDRDHDGEIRIDEILAAVREALDGCQPPAASLVDTGDGTIGTAR